MIKVAIIGGSGLDDPDLLENRQEKVVSTPFGQPSDALICGKIKGVDCVLLARHGRKHTINPSNVNYRANMYALHQEGCTHVLVTTACGSLHTDVKPGQIVVLDQFIDMTKNREYTFFDGSSKALSPWVCHMPMAKPFCEHTRKILIDCAQKHKIDHHKGGTYLVIEGPRFSTFAESMLWQSWGAHVIGMTLSPEVSLAKELGLCYAAIALPTDYDCWRMHSTDHGESVNVQMVLQTFRENAQKALTILQSAIESLAAKDWTKILSDNKKIVEDNTMSRR